MPYKKGEGKSVVIALGGNALGDSPQEQLELVKNTAEHIVAVSYTHLNSSTIDFVLQNTTDRCPFACMRRLRTSFFLACATR